MQRLVPSVQPAVTIPVSEQREADEKYTGENGNDVFHSFSIFYVEQIKRTRAVLLKEDSSCSIFPLGN